MESQEFTVLYTHQKMKKSKVWQDGILKLSHLGNKAVLYDDKGECLDSLFLKHPEVKPGDDLESDRFLITVEEVRAARGTAVNQDVGREGAEFRPRQLVSSGQPLGCQPAGLKRRFAGFQGPRQVPKRRAVMEGGGSTASREAVYPGPSFLSTFLSTPLLFPAAGGREANGVSTDPENTVVCKDRGGQDWPLSAGGPALSSRSRPDGLWEEHLLCSLVSPADRLAPSFLTREPMQRERAASPCFRVTETVRSKAQILALLKSKPASVFRDGNAEMAGHCPQVQPRGSVNSPTEPECLTEQKECILGTAEGVRCQQPAENTVRRGRRWTMYLSSQSSPVHSPVDGNDQERTPKGQGEDVNLNLRDLLVQKRIQFFETGAENGKKYNEDRPVDDTTPYWDQDVKLAIPSFCESQRLPITCGVGNDGRGSELDIPENTKIAVNHYDQMCMNRSILTRENAQEINSCGTPEQTVSNLQESECPQIDSSLSNNSEVSDVITNMFSRSDADKGSLSFLEPMRNVMQPVLEVNFNLNNFETSDTEEESQEGDRMSQDREGWEKETLADDCCSGAENRYESVHCEGGDSTPLPPLPPVGAKPVETFPTDEALPSQLCGKRCVGFDTGPWKAGPMCGDSALEWTDDVYVGDEDVTTPIQKVRSNYDFASVLNKPKGTNSNLHISHCLNVDTNQTPESNLFSKQTQHQPFIRESDLEGNDGQVLRLTSGSDNSIQLLNASPSHHEECIALDKSSPQVASSLFYPLGRKHPIFKDTEAHVPGSEDLGGIPSLPHDQIEVATAGEGGQTWNSPRSSSEPLGFLNSISLLKSLSEYSTAFKGLEILKKKNRTGTQQGTLPMREPESSPEAGKPLVTVVPQVGPKSPRLNQDSQQLFPLGREEDTTFVGAASVQTERGPWGFQVQL
ncbi:5'-3' DNA helicase ZGRF1-like [Saccopteryx bilineata]|uniref:5'-3' DNA helicase ZGRF1-like n=1 Tax=Saccopteryx bilineata TaxID=59482 RepID=UPI00338F73A2